MRRIAHISDLHFGHHDPGIPEALLQDLHRIGPDLIAISGDLTQRARRHEFELVSAFISRLKPPVIVVPGNHDVPLYNVGRRLFRPLARFRHYISDDRQPFFADAELAVCGLDTARALTISGGRINREQLRDLLAAMLSVPAERFRIVVTHHPLLAPPERPELALVGGAEEAAHAFAEAGIDLVLAGHYHGSYTADLRGRYPAIARSILVVHAGTAVSTRTRDERNAYNVIEVDPPRLGISVHSWDGSGFRAADPLGFVRRRGRWTGATEREDLSPLHS